MLSQFPASLRVIARSVVDWWDSWLDMVLMTGVWLLAQVTIILGPPATFGYYHVVSNMVSGHSMGVRGMVEGARLYFGKAWLWAAVNILVMLVIGFATWFYLNVKAAWGLYAAFLVLMVGYLWVCAQFYGLPYFMELKQQSLYTALKNGLFTTLAAPFFTLILMIMMALVLAVSIFLIIPLFLGLLGLIPLMGFRGVYDRLDAFGLHEREETPKEIEVEQGARIYVPDFDHRKPENSASVDNSSLRSGGSAGHEVADGEGQVEQKE